MQNGNSLSIDEIVGVARSIKSLMHREEIVYLCSLAQQAPDGLGVEIGVYMGSSLAAWSLMREGRGPAVGIDNWSYRDIEGLRDKCSENLQRVHSPAMLIDGTSEVAVMGIKDPIAFLLIDGDHTRPAIEQDILIWTPRVMQGGIVAFHDYGRHKDGCYVTEAVGHWQINTNLKWTRLNCVTTLIGFRRE